MKKHQEKPLVAESKTIFVSQDGRFVAVWFGKRPLPDAPADAWCHDALPGLTAWHGKVLAEGLGFAFDDVKLLSDDVAETFRNHLEKEKTRVCSASSGRSEDRAHVRSRVLREVGAP